MKSAFLFASGVAFAFSLNAQMTVSLKRFPARSPEITIRNDSTASLTAFAVRLASIAQGDDDRGPFLVYVDSAIDTDRRISPQLTATMPLPTLQEYTVAVPARLRPSQARENLFKPPIVSAGVFADGTTTGDATLLTRLIARRSNMLQAVELARDILSDAGAHNVGRGQLIGQFRKLADSLDHWYLPVEQQVGRALYQSLIGKLMNLPELQFGSPFPPTEFLRQETALLNRQRTVLLESQPNLSLATAVVSGR